jgi:hypothetical protein
MTNNNDLILSLPADTIFTQLLIDQEFSEYNELLQRVVVYVLLHGTLDKELQLSGVDLASLSGTGTTGALQAVEQALRAMENRITTKLNEDVPEYDKNNRIRTLSLSLQTVDQRFKLRVDIETEAGNIFTGVAGING